MFAFTDPKTKIPRTTLVKMRGMVRGIAVSGDCQSVRILFLPQEHCGVALRWCAPVIAALVPEGGIINPAGHEIVKIQKLGRTNVTSALEKSP